MEALAAIGLASNVLQFADFVSKLLTVGNELHGSASGASQKSLELERVYSSLSRFNLNFQKGNGTHDALDFLKPAGNAEIVLSVQHATALRNLADDCRAVCDELLGVLGRLRVAHGRWRAFNSFRAAMMTINETKTIAELEGRIARFQRTIAFHFLPIISAQQSALTGMMTSLKDENIRLNLDQSAKLIEVSKKLDRIEKKLWTQNAKEERPSGIIAPSESERHSFGLAGAFQQPISHQEDKIASKVQLLTESMSAITITRQTLRHLAKEQAFLSSLSFPSRSIRHESIPLAYRQTFGWVLSIPQTPAASPSVASEYEQDESLQTRLANWLRHGDGIFWVSGKAGSGKSTLMKYMADHVQTESLLQDWAHPKQLVIASHYFWSAGTAMQKSKLGLLQSLLFEILRTCPDLIPDVCGERWAATGATSSFLAAEWTSHELLRALQDISRVANLQTRYCFFIDGADEFKGDLHDLCETFQTLSKSENFKICMSSRPWNVFEDFFGHDNKRKLYIHEVTDKDIQQFTTSRLEEHPRWKSDRFQPKDKTSIIKEITEKAQGVFLWVFLVTNSLRDGLTNGDTRADLWSRLRSLPTDLDKFCKHMLDSIDPLYTEKMAHTLRVSINAEEPLHFIIFNMMEREFDSYATESLDDDEEEFSEFALQAADPEDNAYDECKRRINARCGGLLDVKKSGTVEFLHRTVRDFLLLHEMSDYLESKSSVWFKTNVFTLKAFISALQSKTQSFVWEYCGLREVLRQAFQYANDAIDEDPDVAFTDLEGLGIWTQTQMNGSIWRVRLDCAVHEVFRQEILKAGVEPFVRRIVQDSPNYFDSLRHPPLETVLKEGLLTAQHVRILAQLIKADKYSEAHDARYIQAKLENIFCQTFLDSVGENEAAQVRETEHARPHTLQTNATNAPASNLPQAHPYVGAQAIIAAVLSGRQPVVKDKDRERLDYQMAAVDPAAINLSRLNLYAATLHKVVDIGKQLDWDMELVLSSFLPRLPELIRSRVARIVRCSILSRTPVKVSRKRVAEVNASCSPPVKKRKAVGSGS
ncbi:putative NACHT domain-containing protein [Seiridium unicorne]|uniref:NACHT domain-containing protein n=1 Tax=Seiridium unicorne TaxID=138068 RepID=A0ABR2V4E9_9PEZI